MHRAAARWIFFYCPLAFRHAPWLLYSSSRAQSGIDISDEILSLFEDVKLRHKHKYFIFSLKNTGKVRSFLGHRGCANRRCCPAPESVVSDSHRRTLNRSLLR